MKKQSAGIILYKRRNTQVEVFLVHPGGPFWAKKDLESWSIPKGEIGEGEVPLEVAKREFAEETGVPILGEFIGTEALKQPSGKLIHAWFVEGDCDATAVKSNTFTMEWPPKSGKMQEFPEVDRAEWFDLKSAARKILKGQRPFLSQLTKHLGLGDSVLEDASTSPLSENGQQELF